MTDDVVSKILAFLDSIGIGAIACELREPTFLPGLTIAGGKILYDPTRLEYPGDLLHEAGHIAFTPAAERATLSPQSTFEHGCDLAAIAWSYAAALHIGIDSAVVFHEGGYQGSSRAFIENFAAGRYVGPPLLAWAEMTSEPKPGRTGAYPVMQKWLRD